ncbi:hypothetical protein NA57DRAFT_74865 [Rhizodiscina lignyota]|uniref:Vps53 N-terminal domain-containing protein n=1 Tax=Rhizodiscina lignyota TaxID=1504668 RepID=A0A9P4IHM8_9PEZI|nr:hypothetical protein NA57DRAFT_74865 [Rhizodiscina lignyota]
MPAATVTTASSLDSPDYDPIDHLNAIFSHPSTLASVETTSDTLRQYQRDLDEDISEHVTAQLATDTGSVQRIQAAKAELAELFKKIENVRERAIQTEQTITEMTADIKRLDGTKRNLTLSMTALKRLQMLTTAYEQLRGLSKTRQYRECAQLLQAVMQLAAHFKSYRSIDQIATLSRNVADLQRELMEQVCEDFEVTFAKAEVSQRKRMLAEACLVMDALGEHARSRLITWYCNTQLREYRQVFRGNDEAGSLDNISRRYSWFNRMLKTYDNEHASIFPSHWRVNEMLANAFCEGTRDDFKAILQRSMRRIDGQTIDVNLLLSCLQETLDFEHSLDRRFANDSRASIDTMTSRDEKPPSSGHLISEAFEPYMTLWVESQDKQLGTLIPKYRQQPIRNADEEFSPQSVMASSTELFHFYRLGLAQCAKLSTGSRLLELSKTFAKYLEEYSQQVLFYFLSERFGPQGPSIEDCIVIINTADYCYQTSNQLEEKIKGRIDEEFRSSVDLQSQADAFMGIASATIRALVRKVETECEPAWREMRNTPWGKLESVGDQSTYVALLLQRLQEKATEIIKYMHKQQYSRAFCDNMVDSVVTTFINNIVQCKPVSEVGAEQMLLDSYALKKGLTELGSIGLEPGTPPPQSFVKRVTTTTAKFDPLLKTLQVRPSPPEALVSAYLIHIADRSDTNFRKILELKGIRRPEQTSLLEIFTAHCSAPSNVNLVASSPLLGPLQIAASQQSTAPATTGAADSKGIAGGRFDPGAFGSALISAAREGVDRFGSPALGSGGQRGSDNPSPPTVGGLAPAQQPEPSVSTGNLNENLKNLGKFFRRDGAVGFGRFGGKS